MSSLKPPHGSSLGEPITKSQIVDAAKFEAPTDQAAAPTFRLTAGHVALAIFALACLVFIGFISLAKSIQVTAVTPNLNKPDELLLQTAEIDVATTLKLPLGNRVLVLPGSHQVSLNAEGFQSLTQIIDVKSDRHQQFEIVMSRLPGKLDVQLPEGVTAQLSIDGQSVDEVPATIQNISAGFHEITIDADLYRPFTKRLLIEGKGRTQVLNAPLQPAWATYQFSSEPAGANVVIDGELKAKTPSTVRIEEGTRQLEIVSPGFKPFKQELSVVANEEITAPTVSLIPSDGVIEVASEPAGAAIILNGEFRGTSPMSLSVAPNQNQSLKVYKAGYRLSEKTLSLQPAQVQAEQVQLSPDLIQVKVSVRPETATVYIDGQNRGTGSQTVMLNSLPHSVKVTKPGYVAQTNQIVPTRSSAQVLSFDLLTVEQDYWSKIPPTYTNRFGHEMKLFRSLGSVSLGSSRREDGRRANEAVYDVQLTKPFYVATLETTNKQFRRFKTTHNAGNYKGKSLDANKAPALNVTWQQAAQYCNWLSKNEGLDPFYQTVSGFVSGVNPDANGYRLLTEAEWAWLARETPEGSLTYPWGNTKSPPSGKKIENFADDSAASIITFTLAGYKDGFSGPAPVGRFPANQKGLFDLTGNAAEWVHDWYSAKGSSELSSGKITDPLGPDNGEFHVIRGASWARGYLPQLRLAYRDYAAKGAHDVGFRVARYAGLNKSKQRTASVK